MNLERHEIKNFLQKAFSVEKMSAADIAKLVSNMGIEGERHETWPFLYELAQVNSLAALILWNKGFQKRMANWAKENIPNLESAEFAYAVTSLFPFASEDCPSLYLNGGKASVLELDVNARVSRPVAFRELPWQSLQHTKSHYGYDETALKKFLRLELVGIAAIVAGLKKKLFENAVVYAKSRIQGNRPIYQWSEVQRILSQLYLVVTREEKHVAHFSEALALDVLNGADAFASSAMQVFGGAGYTEDYGAERFFRECVFLKNWLLPLKETQIQFVVDEVLDDRG